MENFYDVFTDRMNELVDVLENGDGGELNEERLQLKMYMGTKYTVVELHAHIWDFIDRLHANHMGRIVENYTLIGEYTKVTKSELLEVVTKTSDKSLENGTSIIHLVMDGTTTLTFRLNEFLKRRVIDELLIDLD